MAQMRLRPPALNATAVLCEAADALPQGQPSESQLVALLRLHLRFAGGDSPCAVLEAHGLQWCLNSLLVYGPESAAGRIALQVVSALAHSPVRPVLSTFHHAWGSTEHWSGQYLSPALRAARVSVEVASSPTDRPRILAIHCGGCKATEKHRAALNADEELRSQLAACLAARGHALQGMQARTIDAMDPRAGIAGIGRGVFATQPWKAHQLVGPYTAWVTCQCEFDTHVPVLRRLEFESYAVTSRHKVIVDGTAQELMFVARPPSIADSVTCEINDWRCIDAQTGKASAPPGTTQRSGPTCCLLEVLHRGWLHLFVVTTVDIPRGGELTAQYPHEFWGQRPRAVAVQAAISREVDTEAMTWR